jgi:hypothetical protein
VVLVAVVEDGHHGNGVIAVVVWASSSEQSGRRRALKNDVVEAVRLCVVLADRGEVGKAGVVLVDHDEVGEARWAQSRGRSGCRWRVIGLLSW